MRKLVAVVALALTMGCGAQKHDSLQNLIIAEQGVSAAARAGLAVAIDTHSISPEDAAKYAGYLDEADLYLGQAVTFLDDDQPADARAWVAKAIELLKIVSTDIAQRKMPA